MREISHPFTEPIRLFLLNIQQKKLASELQLDNLNPVCPNFGFECELSAADYGVRVMVHLGTQPKGKRISIKALAEAAAAPKSFLSKVMQRLVTSRLVNSHRGANGGFELALPPGDITMFGRDFRRRRTTVSQRLHAGRRGMRPPRLVRRAACLGKSTGQDGGDSRCCNLGNAGWRWPRPMVSTSGRKVSRPDQLEDQTKSIFGS